MKARRQYSKSRQAYDRKAELLALRRALAVKEQKMELTLEQMLIELQQRWGSELLLAPYEDDGGWEIEVGPRLMFRGRTPMAAVVQAYREGTK